jgi:hypothetical protein
MKKITALAVIAAGMVSAITVWATCHEEIDSLSGSYLCSSSPCDYQDWSPSVQSCGPSTQPGSSCSNGPCPYVVNVVFNEGGTCANYTCSGGSVDRTGSVTNYLPVLISCPP